MTSRYNKENGSSVDKLADLAAHHIQENEDLLTKIESWRDVDQAKGTTLEKIGENVQQDRGQASDDVFRVLIKSKIKRNLSDGSINTLIDFLSFILNIKKTEVGIQEEWPDGKHASLFVDVPTTPVIDIGLSTRQFGALLNLIVAAGVKANILFEGTFQFASQDETQEFNANEGFANDERTTGGFFGSLYDPKDDVILPF